MDACVSCVSVYLCVCACVSCVSVYLCVCARTRVWAVRVCMYTLSRCVCVCVCVFVCMLNSLPANWFHYFAFLDMCWLSPSVSAETHTCQYTQIYILVKWIKCTCLCVHEINDIQSTWCALQECTDTQSSLKLLKQALAAVDAVLRETEDDVVQVWVWFWV